MKCLPCMSAYVRVCMCAFVTFLHQFYSSFNCQYIFTKFAKNVYSCENMSVKKFVLILKNNVAAMADLKIIDMF